jgi:glucosamine 6-phosphate synthetase-like amidotransferase/phosphosugar isomerase protein
MCGIAGMFDRGSSFSLRMRDMIAQSTEKRGKDGFGCVHIRRSIPYIVQKYSVFKSDKPYSELTKTEDEKWELWRRILNHPSGSYMSTHNCVTLMISRAAPETEGITDANDLERTMQPIIDYDNDLVLVHNGAISNKIHDQLSKGYNYHTNIDSEAILASYVRFGRNIKDAMEFICGGVAAILYDGKKDVLYMINDFKPLAVGYLRGDGLIINSIKEDIDKCIEDKFDVKRNGVCCWESFYSNYLPGGFIHEIDLQSGFISDIPYSPRYMTNVWDSNKKLLQQKGQYEI